MEKTIFLTVWEDREYFDTIIHAHDTKEKAIEKANQRIKEHINNYDLTEDDFKESQQDEEMIKDEKNGYLWDGRHHQEIYVKETTLL